MKFEDKRLMEDNLAPAKFKFLASEGFMHSSPHPSRGLYSGKTSRKYKDLWKYMDLPLLAPARAPWKPGQDPLPSQGDAFQWDNTCWMDP